MYKRAKYKLGDEVICMRYDVGETLESYPHRNDNGYSLRTVNKIDKTFFGRTAIIGKINRTEEETKHGKMEVERDEYQINFTDEIGGSLAWIDGDELIPLYPKSLIISNEGIMLEEKGWTR